MAVHRETHSMPTATMEVHFKLFGTDGVSLQSQELTRALRERGWRVHSCASDLPDDAPGLRLDELSYQSRDAIALRQSVFQAGQVEGGRDDQATGEELLAQVAGLARRIREKVEPYINANDIRLLHIRNIMSLPYNLPATLAFYELARDRSDVAFVMQHHDFFWEGPNARNFNTRHRDVAELIARISCPDLPNATHVVINPIGAEALKARKGISPDVIPDGFDFDREVIALDEEVFRGKLQILAGEEAPVTTRDLVVAMPARVAINKAIELAIQFTAGLEKKRSLLEGAACGVGSRRREFTSRSKIVLLLPQGEDLDENRDYFDRLQAYARHLGINLAYGGHVVVPDRRYSPGDTEHYPFYSTYQAVDLVCYPPEHEGFGNQAIEAVWAMRPLAVLEYPVFKRFVRDHIPHYISLGEPAELGRLEAFGGLHLLREDILERALNAAASVLTDHDLERRWVEENAGVLRRFCGIDQVSQRYISLYSAAIERASSQRLAPD